MSDYFIDMDIGTKLDVRTCKETADSLVNFLKMFFLDLTGLFSLVFFFSLHQN